MGLLLHMDNVLSSINVFALDLLLIITLAILVLAPVRQIAKHRLNAWRIVFDDRTKSNIVSSFLHSISSHLLPLSVNATMTEILAVCLY